MGLNLTPCRLLTKFLWVNNLLFPALFTRKDISPSAKGDEGCAPSTAPAFLSRKAVQKNLLFAFKRFRVWDIVSHPVYFSFYNTSGQLAVIHLCYLVAVQTNSWTGGMIVSDQKVIFPGKYRRQELKICHCWLDIWKSIYRNAGCHTHESAGVS